jgi:glycerate-2-kinase
VNPERFARARLEQLFSAALEAVDPAHAVQAAVRRDADQLEVAGEPLEPEARLVVFAVGKAAGTMARALEALVGDRIAAGLVVVPDGQAVDLETMTLVETAHPIPDERCERAGQMAIDLVAGARPDDVLLAMISGGASSLVSCPIEGVTLRDLADTTDRLLQGGASIGELNTVRKHLSRLSGGRLVAHAASERIEVLAISDVPGDRLDVIGSGPLAADPTTYCDALDSIDRIGGPFPERVRAHLEAGARGECPDTPAPGAALFDRVRSTLLASNSTAIEAACLAAEQRGMRAVALPGCLRGEARIAGRRLAALGVSLACSRPVCAIAGGETAVVVRGTGRGGRNQELALAAAVELAGNRKVALLAVGTDGIDGPTDAAGAYADGETLAHGNELGVDARAALAANDSHSFFAREGGVLRTGPTGTNVMDLAFLYVEP